MGGTNHFSMDFDVFGNNWGLVRLGVFCGVFIHWAIVVCGTHEGYPNNCLITPV